MELPVRTGSGWGLKVPKRPVIRESVPNVFVCFPAGVDTVQTEMAHGEALAAPGTENRTPTGWNRPGRQNHSPVAGGASRRIEDPDGPDFPRSPAKPAVQFEGVGKWLHPRILAGRVGHYWGYPPPFTIICEVPDKVF